jgi:hypothetical protein
MPTKKKPIVKLHKMEYSVYNIENGFRVLWARFSAEGDAREYARRESQRYVKGYWEVENIRFKAVEIVYKNGWEER